MNQPLSIANLDIPRLRELDEGIWTAGQPSAEQLQRAQRAGLRSVVSLCPHGECGWDEKAAVDKLGMAYHSVPISGAGDLSPAAARALADAVRSAPRPMLVHCASSNRVGALFALKAFVVDGLSSDDAVRHGQQAGLVGLESAVRQILANC